MYKWQDKCFQFLLGKGFNREDAQRHLFNFVRDNMHRDFHFDVDTRVNEKEMFMVLVWLTSYHKENLCLTL